LSVFTHYRLGFARLATPLFLALSTGQLLFQVLQLCTHNGLAPLSLLFLGWC